MSESFEAWRAQLEETAVESFFFSREAAAQLAPTKRPSWAHYYEEGFGPQAALEEELDTEGAA